MFASNVGISTSHNYHIMLNKGEKKTFRVLLRPVECGKLTWRFWLSNAVDSTFADGSESRANMPGGRFEIVSSTVGTADENKTLGTMKDVEWPQFVEAGKEALSEEVTVDVPENGYIVFSWCVRAAEDNCRLPVTPDSQALCFTAPGDAAGKGMDAFEEDQTVLLPDLFAADRNVRTKMVFMGDSITQGCGTRVNFYEQWATRIAMGMEKDVAVWNIGLGYGRGGDAATDGVWLAKAKTADIVNLCFGVNDIFQTHDAKLLAENLRKTIRLLHESECKVVLLTIPPFDMVEQDEKDWRYVVDLIREDGLGADAVFDIAAMLCQSAPRDNFAAFGGHPDGRGGAAVAGEYLTAFWPKMKSRLLG